MGLFLRSTELYPAIDSSASYEANSVNPYHYSREINPSNQDSLIFKSSCRVFHGNNGLPLSIYAFTVANEPPPSIPDLSAQTWKTYEKKLKFWKTKPQKVDFSDFELFIYYDQAGNPILPSANNEIERVPKWADGDFDAQGEMATISAQGTSRWEGLRFQKSKGRTNVFLLQSKRKNDKYLPVKTENVRWYRREGQDVLTFEIPGQGYCVCNCCDGSSIDLIHVDLSGCYESVLYGGGD